jgi:hypothetical protein
MEIGKEWTFEHTIECSVSSDFAWKFWTKVENWVVDADLESVELRGGFTAGAHGITHSKSSGRIEWYLKEVSPPRRAVMEVPAPGAVAKFVWTFEDVRGRARITQRASLSGEQASKYVDTVGRALQAGIPAGMRKLCEAMEIAAQKPANNPIPD